MAARGDPMVPAVTIVGPAGGTLVGRRAGSKNMGTPDANLTLLAAATIAKLRRPHTLGVGCHPWRRRGGAVTEAMAERFGRHPTKYSPHPRKSGRGACRAARLWQEFLNAALESGIGAFRIDSEGLRFPWFLLGKVHHANGGLEFPSCCRFVHCGDWGERLSGARVRTGSAGTWVSRTSSAGLKLDHCPQ